MTLNYLADAAQVPLTLLKGAITGERDVTAPTDIPGLAMPATLTVVASFVGPQMGVVLHIKGDLFLLLAHNKATSNGATSAFVVDGAKVQSGWPTLIKSSSVLRDVVALFGKAVVASYYRQPGKPWAKMKATT